MDNMSMIYEALLEVHAEQILNESLRKFREQQLYQEIDDALQNGDQELFFTLTRELKQLKDISEKIS
jgi:uncharacterized protein YpiB (UPF0302 family)